MSILTPEELKILSQYITDPEGDIFCVTNLEGIVGAIYARYSRARGGFREVMLKEFIKEGMIDIQHASDLIDRVLVAYGDDSVGELEGAHLSIENISILATKEVEDRRIGGSPIEQSTRYVFYDQKDDQGRWKYYREPRIMVSAYAQEHEQTMDFIFQTYADLIEPMKAFYTQLKPIGEAEYDILGSGEKQHLNDLPEKDQKAFTITYNSDIRTKACDSLRSILPIATLTNMGLFGNGRFFQSMLSHLYTSPLSEAQALAKNAQTQLDKVIPKYVKRAKANEYIIANRQRMRAMAENIFTDIEPEQEQSIVLLDRAEQVISERINTLVMNQSLISSEQLTEILQQEFDHLTYAMMLYEFLPHPLWQILKIVRKLSAEQNAKLRQAYIGDRYSRRDRPGRALEAGYPYTFDLTTDFGTYKDLMRHRQTSQLRQAFSPRLGFIVSLDVKTAGFEEKVLACHERIAELYEKIYPDLPQEASYCTLHGHKVRWLMSFNEREAYHLLELRTTPQGHPQYRKVCQLMHEQIRQRSAWRAESMKFVDHNDYFWSRADSEARQRVQERKLGLDSQEEIKL